MNPPRIATSPKKRQSATPELRQVADLPPRPAGPGRTRTAAFLAARPGRGHSRCPPSWSHPPRRSTPRRPRTTCRRRRSTRSGAHQGTTAGKTGRTSTRRGPVQRRSTQPLGLAPGLAPASCGPPARAAAPGWSRPTRWPTTRRARARREREPLRRDRQGPPHPHRSIPRFRRPRRACPLPSRTGPTPANWTRLQVSEIPKSKIRNPDLRKVDSHTSSRPASPRSARHDEARHRKPRLSAARHAPARGWVGSTAKPVEPARPTRRTRCPQQGRSRTSRAASSSLSSA